MIELPVGGGNRDDKPANRGVLVIRDTLKGNRPGDDMSEGPIDLHGKKSFTDANRDVGVTIWRPRKGPFFRPWCRCGRARAGPEKPGGILCGPVAANLPLEGAGFLATLD